MHNQVSTPLCKSRINPDYADVSLIDDVDVNEAAAVLACGDVAGWQIAASLGSSSESTEPEAPRREPAPCLRAPRLSSSLEV